MEEARSEKGGRTYIQEEAAATAKGGRSYKRKPQLQSQQYKEASSHTNHNKAAAKEDQR
jgi:hypothetical protein